MIEAIQKIGPWLLQLPTVPKLVLSLGITLFSAFILVVLWSPMPNTGENNIWPKEKTTAALERRIERISKKDQETLRFILNAGRHGIYPNDLKSLFSPPLTERELIVRTDRLKLYGLIEILDLTEENYRISESVQNLYGSDYVGHVNLILRP